METEGSNRDGQEPRWDSQAPNLKNGGSGLRARKGRDAASEQGVWWDAVRHVLHVTSLHVRDDVEIDATPGPPFPRGGSCATTVIPQLAQ